MHWRQELNLSQRTMTIDQIVRAFIASLHKQAQVKQSSMLKFRPLAAQDKNTAKSRPDAPKCEDR